jgi:hypothetical protein
MIFYERKWIRNKETFNMLKVCGLALYWGHMQIAFGSKNVRVKNLPKCCIFVNI